ncbi:MAG: ATP-binding protein, partial [Bdellovibrionales bacterium]|nr:ATP-binding protein [Bdellovibrionales bacterium]
QYDLSIDEFIKEIYFEKQLSLVYTPVWSEEDTIEKMIVSFQDFSEVAGLKEDVKQIKDQELENSLIIKELTKVVKEDIENFLSESISFLTNLKNLIFKLKQSPEVFEEIKRELHTIKGNARMVKFDKISQTVHDTEAFVETIDPTSFSEVNFFDLLNKINKLFKLVSRYSSIANQIYQIKDEHFLLNITDFHRLNGKLNLQFREGNQDLLGFFSESLEIAEFIAPKDFQNKISKIISSLENGIFPQKEIREYFDAYWQFFIQSQFSDSINYSLEFWRPIILNMIAISEDNSSDKTNDLNELKNLCRTKELFFMERIVVKIIKLTEQKKKTDEHLSYLWDIIAFILNKTCTQTYSQSLLARAIDTNDFSELDIKEPLTYFIKNDHESFIRCMERFVSKKTPPLQYLFKQYYKKEDLVAFIDGIGIGLEFPDHQSIPILSKVLNPPEEFGELFLMSFIFRLINSQVLTSDQKDETDKVLPIYSKNISNIIEYYNKLSIDDPNFIKMGHFLKNLEKLPLDFYFLPLPDMTKEVSMELGKEVEFILESELCFLPKKEALIIRDCMIHLIRNSIDHGIETPKEREQKNKTPKAQIKVTLGQTNGQFNISYKDDGKGLDRDKIIEKAKLSKDLPNEEVYKSIFLPSFSTREDVTVLSGRGIGMNVVYNSIVKDLNGELELDSDQSKGFGLKIIIPNHH